MPLTLVLGLSPTLPACDRHPPAAVESFSGAAEGTTYHIKLAQPPEPLTREVLQEAITTVLTRIDREMSAYRPDSDLSRFNASQGTDWFPVSGELRELVDVALQVSRETDGAYDITVEPLSELWGFGPQRHVFRVPTDAEIERARLQVGHGHLHSRRDPPALRKDVPELRIDVNSLGPGYTVDRIARALSRLGVDDYLIELGGAVYARGQRPEGGAWRVAIEKPLKTSRVAQQIVGLSAEGLSTAGDYRQYFDEDGRHYSHILDPATGRPVTHALTSVSVIAPIAVEADAWDTALMVMGPERGWALALKLKIPALFITRETATGQSDFKVRATPQFEPYARPPK
ncbi:MAG TPA: FAD:protein FMN transferase [Gammaproteobacteria bacterium]|nr:FAD:protein FMN transferase [Gammaproteobacteria bacterium]